VTQVLSRGAIDTQPEFFIRTVDSSTGQLMWTDHFSTQTGRLARPERVGRAAVGQTEGAGVAASSQQIEFRIRMTDDRGRKILWEDTIEPTVEETDVLAGHDDAAEILPAWRGAGPEEMEKDLI
jgi:TolB-like protein